MATVTDQDLKNIYKGELGRDIDEEGLKFYTDAINSGQKTLSQVINEISSSKEGLEYDPTGGIGDYSGSVWTDNATTGPTGNNPYDDVTTPGDGGTTPPGDGGTTPPTTPGGVTTAEGIEQKYADIIGQVSGSVPTASVTKVDTTSSNTILGDTTGQLDTRDDATAKTISDVNAYDVTAPTAPEETPQMTATAASKAAVEGESVEAATLSADEVSPEVTIGELTGTISDKSVAEAQTGEVMEEQTVSYQLGKLYDSIKEGQPLPAWASGPARAAAQMMSARGLGASSMAGAALATALAESALPIAQADAAEYSKLNIANLNNRQAAALQNAATYAQMDLANLDAKTKAAVQNAKSFLSIDLANLTNEQASNIAEYESVVQAIFTDQAAENVAAQFNTKLQADVDMFYDELASQVETANANRSSALAQFNADQENAMTQFNEEINNARDQFNSNMEYLVSKSNAEWRREANLVNTAATNAAAEQNAARAAAAQQTAMNNVWNAWQDEAAFIRDTAENERQRAHEVLLKEMTVDASFGLAEYKAEMDAWGAVGEFVGDTVRDAIKGE